MRVWEIREGFGLDHLVRGERPEPECGPRDVVVEVAATSLNYRDLLMVNGLYNPRQRLPLIPLSDGVGRVVAVGSQVGRAAVGDRVAANFVRDWMAGDLGRAIAVSALGGPLDGMLAQRVCLPEWAVVAVPEHLGDAEAATLPCAGLTAWTALFEDGGLLPGQTVLLQGTGGVSIAGLQLALLAGARTIITSSSDDKLERVRELGAHHTINYKSDPEWGKTAKKLAGGEGVDVVLEVGGADTFEQSLRAVRMNGRIAVIGILSGAQKAIRLTSILMRKVRVQGVLVGHRQSFEALMKAVDLHQMRPVIDRVFPFDRVREAFQYLASGKHIGKVCVSGGADAEAKGP